MDRFWNKVDVKERHECWEWNACKNPKGYGQFNVNNKRVLAHRYSFQTANPTTDIQGLVVRHSCDNPSCVNPSHLSAGTCADNSKDMVSRGRASRHHRRLTDDQIQQIKSDYRTPRELAPQYGVSRQTIYRIQTNLSWSHIK